MGEGHEGAKIGHIAIPWEGYTKKSKDQKKANVVMVQSSSYAPRLFSRSPAQPRQASA